MKKLLPLIYFVFISGLTAQLDERIVRMDAIEDSSGGVHIFYRKSDVWYPSDDIIRTLPIRYLNAQTREDTLLLDPATTNKHYHTVQFFDNDPWKYITGGAFGDKPDKVFIHKFDGSIIEYPGHICKVFVDNISNLTYANIIDTLAQTYKLIHSTDRGITWTDISDAPEFRMLNVCPFRESIFGYNDNGGIIESENRGNNSFQISFTECWDNSARIFYDNTRGTVAASCLIDGKCHFEFLPVDYDLFTDVYTGYEKDLMFACAPGEKYGQRIFVGLKNILYTCGASVDSLFYIEPIESLPKGINGLFRPSYADDIFYFSSNYFIMRNNGEKLDTLLALNGNQSHHYFPLKKGNSWFYDCYLYNSGNSEDIIFYQKKLQVTDDSVLINGYIWSKIAEYSHNSIFLIYRRVDKNGKIFDYKDNAPSLFLDMRAAAYDSVVGAYSSRYFCEEETFLNFNNYSNVEKDLFSTGTCGNTEYKFLNGIGPTFTGSYNPFSTLTVTLRGAYINGVVYGDTNITSVKEPEITPENFSLSEAYPNPFNPSTKLDYSVPEYSLVTAELFDIKGEKIRTLLNENKAPGRYSVVVEMGNYVSGVYIIKLSAGKQYITRKIILLK